MKRIRALGLTVVLALSITVIAGAATASASKFVADGYPSVVTGKTSGIMTLSNKLGTVECNAGAFGGELTDISDPLSATGAEAPCTYDSLKANGCKLNFHPGTETSVGHFTGTFDIAGCTAMTYRVLNCVVKLPPQTGLSATYENLGSGASAEVVIHMEASSAKFEVKGCVGVPDGTYTGQGIQGTWKMSAGSGGLKAAGPNGFFMNSGSGGQFDAEAFPAILRGAQYSIDQLKTNVGTTECESVVLNGTAAKATNSVSLAPTFANCEMVGQVATPSTNGCVYTYGVTGANPFTGTMQLSCPAGQQLEFRKGACSVKFPSQTFGSATFTTQGSLTSRKVLASTSGSSLEYSIAGTGCATGTYKNGTYTGSSLTEALR